MSAEFSRIVSKDLLDSFLDGLDALVPSLIQIYKAAAESGRRVRLKSIMNCLLKEVCLCQKKNLINKYWYEGWNYKHCIHLLFVFVGHKPKQENCCPSWSSLLPFWGFLSHNPDVWGKTQWLHIKYYTVLYLVFVSCP